MSAQRSRVLQVSLGVILSAFAVELVLGTLSNSLALITDSVHALLDGVVTAILLLAARMAAKPPDAEHTYGHGKMESLGGLIGGIAIFLLACFFIYESVSRIQSPPPAVLPGALALAGAAYTMGADGFRIALLGRSLRRLGGQTLRADFYHALMDMGSTGVAMAGIALASYGFYSGDLAAALILGVLLAAMSVRLVHRTAMELTDVISPEVVRDVRRTAESTDGVRRADPVLVRRSGDTVFADITISLRGDVSFEAAHEISSRVEANIGGRIPGASVRVHFEPSWDGVPVDSRILEVARRVEGVRGVHNVSTHRSRGRTFADLHAMVDSRIDLESAHRISEEIELRIRKDVPGIEHATVHLEPFVDVSGSFELEDAEAERRTRRLLEGYAEVRRIGRIVSLRSGNVRKIDIDCSFDGGLSIERVHDLTSQIEHGIRGEIKNSVITIHPEPD